MIDLKLFCEKNEADILSTPWSAGEFSYATNRKIVIRVPRDQNIPLSDSHVQDADKTIDTFMRKIPENGMNVLPEFEVTTHLCDLYKSDQCDGDGLMCDVGGGDIRFCKVLCDYQGKIQDDTMVLIGASVFAAPLLALIKSLPGLKIGTFGGEEPAAFTFNGGVGLIASMKL